MSLLQDVDAACNEEVDVWKVQVIEMEVPNVPGDAATYRVAGPHRHHLTQEQKCDVLQEARERLGGAEPVFGRRVVAEVAYKTTTSEIRVFNGE